MTVLKSYPEASDPFFEDSDSHVGLNFAYGAGRVADDGAVSDTIAGTVLLANNDTNYIEVDLTDGTVSANTTGFSGGDQWPLYTAVTAAGMITTVTDKRALALRTSGASPVAHDLGGAAHNADTLAHLNDKVSDIPTGLKENNLRYALWNHFL